MDGKLDEWAGAFETPVNFGHADWQDRAAVWHYLWNEENLYIGLECLDTTIFNKDPGPIYNGDGVEFYLDLRSGAELERSPFLGPLFEGFIASEILKSQINRGARKELYHFRDQQGLEVDFLFPDRHGKV